MASARKPNLFNITRPFDMNANVDLKLLHENDDVVKNDFKLSEVFNADILPSILVPEKCDKLTTKIQYVPKIL